MSHLRNQILLVKIGKRLKLFRENAHLTQEAVFNDTEIHIGRIESAATNVKISTLDAIYKYYKIELDQFLRNLLSYHCK